MNAKQSKFELTNGIKLADWRGAQERGNTGVEVIEGWMARAMFEVPAIPDFSSPRFANLANLEEAQRLAAVVAKQAQLLSALHALGPKIGISLRYATFTGSARERRLRLFVIGRAYGETALEAERGANLFTQVFLGAFPREYPFVSAPSTADDPMLDAVLNLGKVASLVEIIKPERIIKPWHATEICGFSHYYISDPFLAGNSPMTQTCNALMREQADFTALDVTLIPAARMTTVEQVEARLWTAVCEQWSRDQRREVGGGLYSKAHQIEIEADPAASDVGSAYDNLIQAYGATDRLFLYAVRVLSSNPESPVALATAVAAEALSPGAGCHLRSVPQTDGAFQRALTAARLGSISPAVCNDAVWQRDDASETLRRLHRLVGVEEIAGFFRLPIVGREGCPGLPMDSGIAMEAPNVLAKPPVIELGYLVEDNQIQSTPVDVSLKELPKSALIVGMPGSGKTTLCFAVLSQLWRDHRIPFLVLEPAKSEYRALMTLPELADDLWVFTVGNERICPFRLNPFEVPEGVAVSEHISALMTCFTGAFELWEPLPMILERAIRAAYRANNWSEYEAGGERPELEPPTMDTVYRHALAIAAQTSYQGETAGNIKGAIETRLGSLLTGPKGRCFNSRRSIPLAELLARPVILELDALNDEEKALLMMFVLTLIRSHAKQSRGSGAPLTHVLLIEEAHVVIGRADANQGSEGGNPKSVAIRMFTRALAEMRALGEGIVIADQLPTAIAPEAIKNTNVKVMHRLVSADDRNELGQAMILDPGQLEQAATLMPGRAFVHKEGWPKARLVAEQDFKSVYQVDVPPLDRDILRRMTPVLESEILRSVYLPYPGCADVCRACSVRLREEVERACLEIVEELVQKGELNDLSSAQLYFMDAAQYPDDPDLAIADTSNTSVQLDEVAIMRRGCIHVFLSNVFTPLLQFHQSRSQN